jgi:hypothetical protein
MANARCAASPPCVSLRYGAASAVQKKLSICKNLKKPPKNAAAVHLIYEQPLYIAQLSSVNSIRYKTSEQQKNNTS